jgi:hypothetical protein
MRHMPNEFIGNLLCLLNIEMSQCKQLEHTTPEMFQMLHMVTLGVPAKNQIAF